MSSLRLFRSVAYGIARGLGHVIAIGSGRVGPRIINVLIGRSAGRILNRIWR